MKFDLDWPSGFRGDVLRVWMTEAYLSYKLTSEPLAQVSYKKKKKKESDNTYCHVRSTPCVPTFGY